MMRKWGTVQVICAKNEKGIERDLRCNSKGDGGLLSLFVSALQFQGSKNRPTFFLKNKKERKKRVRIILNYIKP
jgi:hypothetical protein